jgi:nitroimidazol reductase NimA-like FMN-containing flavoprotein (pyridoxamine 5'-phosphate oxidase superfamily)
MSHHDIEQWEETQAEIAIRRWLYSIGQWAPGAELGPRPAEGTAPAVMNDEQIEQVLRRELVGRVACHAQGRTYVVPVIYAYDGGSIYGHSNDGMKIRMLRANPEVCFEVDHVESITNWQSVILWGRFQELEGEQATRAEQLLVERIKPLLLDRVKRSLYRLGDGEDAQGPMVEQRAVVYRIAVAERTGRCEQR